MKTSLINRFLSKIEVIPFHACWEWVGAKNEKGYGIISLGSRKEGKIRAHRLSYILHIGPLLDAQVVCHRCDNPGCTRPEHLFAGSKKDNSQDMIKKNRGKGHFIGANDPRMNNGLYNTLKTLCPHGHEYNTDNLVSRKDNRRECKTCARIRRANKRNRN